MGSDPAQEEGAGTAMNTLELSLLDQWDEEVLTAAVAAFVRRRGRLPGIENLPGAPGDVVPA